MTRAFVVRAPNWIGDFLMALPALEAFRRLFPDARFALQVHDRCRALAERLGFVDTLHSLPDLGGLRRAGYDLGVLFTPSLSSALLFGVTGIPRRVGWAGEGRSPLLTRRVPRPDRDVHQSRHFLGLAAALGYAGEDPPLRFAVSAADEDAADRWLAGRLPAGRDLYALAPVVAFGPAKMWPAVRFRELADRLSADAGVLLIGSAAEAAVLEEIGAGLPGAHVLAGDLSLPEVGALLKRCRGFVGNDSGLLHLARAVGTPVVGIYGSTNPRWTGPGDDEGTVVSLHLECSPCYRRECPLPGSPRTCLTEIPASRVESALREVLR